MKLIILGSTSKTAHSLFPMIKEKSNEIESFWVSSSKKPNWFDLDNWVEIDYNNINDIVEFIHSINPDVVVNLCAYTDVDGCEDNKSEAYFINYELPKTISELSKDSFHFIHISTDYVFDGLDGLYEIDAKVGTKNIGWYGLSKQDSENQVLKYNGTIIRTNVLYDDGSYRPNFLLWMKSQIKEKSEISIVYDQFNNPTLINDLAKAIVKVIENSIKGIIHVGGSDWMSRWELSQVLALSLDSEQSTNLLSKIDTKSLNQKAFRPKFGGLSIQKSEELLDIKFSGIYDFILHHSELEKDSNHFIIFQRLIYALRNISNEIRKCVHIDITRNPHGTLSIHLTNDKIWTEIEIGKTSFSGVLYGYNETNLQLLDGDIYDDETFVTFLKKIETYS